MSNQLVGRAEGAVGPLEAPEEAGNLVEGQAAVVLGQKLAEIGRAGKLCRRPLHRS